MNEDCNVAIEITGGQSDGKTAFEVSLVFIYIVVTSQQKCKMLY